MTYALPGGNGAEGGRTNVPDPCPVEQGQLHRLRAVREQQGLSLRAAARQMGVSIRQLRLEEEGAVELRLSDLYRWQRALEVPIADLLVEPGLALSPSVADRARLVRLMKTANAILEQARTAGVRRLAQCLVEQLIEIMPELKHIGTWHSVGQRRTLDELGRTYRHQFSEDGAHCPSD